MQRWGRAGPKAASPRPHARSPAAGTALIVNPTKVGDVGRLHRRVTKRCRVHGHPEPVVLLTTREDPGEGLARQAVRSGAGLVLSAGGDGTVMSVARGLAGTAVPLGVLPVGTGNVLARNLDLPLTLIEALEVALTGADRCIDLGVVRTDTRPAEAFTVMAGMGFDAAIMADAPEALKAKVGPIAYVVSGLRLFNGERVRVRLEVDGNATTRRVRTIVVGNVGRLQGGLTLMPDAEVDDGWLDVVAIGPRGIVGWLDVVGRLVTRRRRKDTRLQHWRGRSIVLAAESPQPAQLDGDPIGDVSELRMRVDEGAVVVRVAAGSRRTPGPLASATRAAWAGTLRR